VYGARRWRSWWRKAPTLLVVDESTPGDRVYEVLDRYPRIAIDQPPNRVVLGGALGAGSCSAARRGG
jgi:hypothetical protein